MFFGLFLVLVFFLLDVYVVVVFGNGFGEDVVVVVVVDEEEIWRVFWGYGCD